MVDIIVVIITSSFAFFTGRLVYLRQKEYEEVHRRYLIDTIDLLCNNNDKVLAIFKHNWARSLQLIKQFRDADLIMEKEDYNNQFIPFDYDLTKIVPFERLKRLVNDNIFYEYSQQLWGFVDNSYSIYERDFKMAIAQSY